MNDVKDGCLRYLRVGTFGIKRNMPGQKRKQEGGGRSARYTKRRAQRGTVGSHAPAWTDGDALAVQRQVQALVPHRPDQSVATSWV